MDREKVHLVTLSRINMLWIRTSTAFDIRGSLRPQICVLHSWHNATDRLSTFWIEYQSQWPLCTNTSTNTLNPYILSADASHSKRYCVVHTRIRYFNNLAIESLGKLCILVVAKVRDQVVDYWALNRWNDGGALDRHNVLPSITV